MNQFSSIITTNFSLYKTLTSGQFFNYYYNEQKNTFTCINEDSIFTLSQKDNIIYFEGVGEKYVLNFLGLNFDTSVLEELEDNIFQEAYQKHKNLRVMNTELFQTIISFICSSASNISKIQNNIKLISQTLGEYNSKYNVYSFPKPEQINNYDTLLKCKVGYRAKYIIQVSEFFTNNPQILEDLKYYTYNQAYTLLCSLPGIGSKIANCICLFALKHYESFPVDTWIRKILREDYKFAGNDSQLEHFAKMHFGKYTGYYQQYLFQYSREK
mgnify:CR=1 FL=1